LLDNNNTNGQRGGRTSFVSYSNEVGGGSSRANKTFYSPTITTGSSASCDPLQLHFQLKTLTQTESGQKLSINFLKYAKDCYSKFGPKERGGFPCTWGINEKAGMNAIEFERYFIKEILPLYPDVEDIVEKKG